MLIHNISLLPKRKLLPENILLNVATRSIWPGSHAVTVSVGIPGALVFCAGLQCLPGFSVLYRECVPGKWRKRRPNRTTSALFSPMGARLSIRRGTAG